MGQKGKFKCLLSVRPSEQIREIFLSALHLSEQGTDDSTTTLHHIQIDCERN